MGDSISVYVFRISFLFHKIFGRSLRRRKRFLLSANNKYSIFWPARSKESAKTEDGRRKTEDGRRKKEEGRRKKEEGRRKKEEGRRASRPGTLPRTVNPIRFSQSLEAVRGMVQQQTWRSEDLDACFKKLMVFVGGGEGFHVDMEGVDVPEWKDIPVELLIRILSLVDDPTVIRAAGVCSGWREAISLGLTRLCLSWCKENMNYLVLSLVPKFSKLQTLILRQDKPQLEDNAVEAIANFCHELRELDLSKSFKLTDDSLYALSRGCLNLIKLNISGCSSFSDDGIAHLVSCCRKLKFVNLCGCVKGATDKALQAIGSNCGELQSLNLGWCEKVGDSGVISLANGCPQLRALDLCGCILITDDSVIALANKCQHLRSLGLYYCQNITDRAMYSLASSRGKNNKLRMMSIKKEDEEIGGLMNLNISQCTALTPPAVQAVCDSFPALHTCPGRHSLIISGCLSLTSVHCSCAAVHAHHRASSTTAAH